VLGAKRTIKIAAIDSSGFESRHVSHYFLQRKESRGHPERAVFARFHPKLTLLCDCKTHLILAFLTGKGPSPDNKKLKPTLRNCSPDLVINKLLADAGFDGEPNHVFARDKLGIKTFVPPIIGRPSTKPLNGKYRRLMQRLFVNPKRVSYGQRWQVETVFSMLKRRFATATRARNSWSRKRELALLVLSFNLAILAALNLFSLLYAFLQSMTVTFSTMVPVPKMHRFRMLVPVPEMYKKYIK